MPAEKKAGDAAIAAGPALARAVVAPRRTVMVGDEGRGPGAEVELAADEVERLRKRGFLVDPGAAAAPPVADGPSFSAG